MSQGLYPRLPVGDRSWGTQGNPLRLRETSVVPECWVACSAHNDGDDGARSLRRGLLPTGPSRPVVVVGVTDPPAIDVDNRDVEDSAVVFLLHCRRPLPGAAARNASPSAKLVSVPDGRGIPNCLETQALAHRQLSAHPRGKTQPNCEAKDLSRLQLRAAKRNALVS